MTTGNVTPTMANAIGAVMASPNISQGVDTGKSFQNVINKMTDTGDNTSVKSATATKIDSNRARDNVKANNKNVSKEDVNKLENEIKSKVKDALDISDEELETAMAELGYTVVDLLNPQNVVNLIATIKDTSALEIVTDDGLSQMLSELNKSISEIVANFATENEIPFDYLVKNLSQGTDGEPVITDDKALNNEGEKEASVLTNEEEGNIQIAKVTDSETGKTIEIAAVDNRVVSENVKETSDTGENTSDKKDDKGEEPKNFAENILSTLADNITESVSAVSDVSSEVHVNGVDIINQIMDAVKVNISNDIQSMEIQLTPENLGKINLSVVAKDGMITASIVAQNEGVKNALESQLIMLKEQLDNQGIKVQEVEVTVASQGFNANTESGSGDNNDNKSNARRRFRGVDEISGDMDTSEDEINPTDSNINLKA